MSSICNVPFCQNIKKKSSGLCSQHCYEKTKYNVKKYKEFLPLWSVKRCNKHGLLKKSQTYYHPSNKIYMCLQCKPPYNPEIHKKYNGRYKTKSKESRLKKIYGISISDFHGLIHKQQGKCAICMQPSKRKSLAIDHCHVTGKVRELLCGECNRGLGYFYENIQFLESAINYLSRHK